MVIIKDGVPLFSRSSELASTPLFSNHHDLVMVSGFFSALNSFSDHFENLGSIKELMLSNSDLKLSFFKHESIPNLIFIATHDKESNGNDVQRTLRSLSNTFMNKYNIDQILKWSGRQEAFKSFERIVNQRIEEEQKENRSSREHEDISSLQLTEKMHLEEKDQKLKTMQSSKYETMIPKIQVSINVNPNLYLSDNVASKIFKLIDGTRSISDISNKLNIPSQKVFNSCKRLLKMNFIKLDNCL